MNELYGKNAVSHSTLRVIGGRDAVFLFVPLRLVFFLLLCLDFAGLFIRQLDRCSRLLFLVDLATSMASVSWPLAPVLANLLRLPSFTQVPQLLRTPPQAITAMPSSWHCPSRPASNPLGAVIASVIGNRKNSVTSLVRA